MSHTNPREHGPDSEQERLIDLQEYMAIVGEGRSVAYQLMAAGIAPAPIKVGRSSRWVLSEVRAYVAQKIATAPRKPSRAR